MVGLLRTERKNEEFIKKDVRHIVLKIMLLKMIAAKKSYTYQLFKNVAKSRFAGAFGKEDIKNDVYNTIALLLNSGYIRVVNERDGNSIKKYYTITKKGRESLVEAKKIFRNALLDLSRQFGV